MCLVSLTPTKNNDTVLFLKRFHALISNTIKMPLNGTQIFRPKAIAHNPRN